MAESRRQQRLRDTRRDNGKVGGVGPRDADETVHDAPHRAEQAHERRNRADGGQDAHAASDALRGGGLDALELPGDTLLDAFGGKTP